MKIVLIRNPVRKNILLEDALHTLKHQSNMASSTSFNTTLAGALDPSLPSQRYVWINVDLPMLLTFTEYAISNGFDHWIQLNYLMHSGDGFIEISPSQTWRECGILTNTTIVVQRRSETDIQIYRMMLMMYPPDYGSDSE
jgi:hypothetical protein